MKMGGPFDHLAPEKKWGHEIAQIYCTSTGSTNGSLSHTRCSNFSPDENLLAGEGVVVGCVDAMAPGDRLSATLCSSAPTSHVEAANVRSAQVRRCASTRSKSVSVGAGAEIRQSLSPDPLGVEGWQSEPGAVIRVYFCFREQFLDIIKAGVVELKSEKEGYLKGVPVG